MKEMEYLEELTSRYPVLEAVKGDVLAAYEILRDCYAGGGKLMIAEMAEAARTASTLWVS